MKKIFLISPVRNANKEISEQVKKYVKKLEDQGHKVHWPLRDTDQNDPIGLRICTDNAKAIIKSDEIHIWWNPESRGSIFDFGMAFMFNVLSENSGIFRAKKIILANPQKVNPSNQKSFNNVLLALHQKSLNKETGK